MAGPDDVQLYGCVVDGKLVQVAWWDAAVEGGPMKTVSVAVGGSSVRVTEAIPTPAGSFPAQVKAVVGGRVSIALGTAPVFIE